MQTYDPAQRFTRPDLEAQLLDTLEADPARHPEVTAHLKPTMLSTEEADSRLTRIMYGGPYPAPRGHETNAADLDALARQLREVWERAEYSRLGQRLLEADTPPAELRAAIERTVSAVSPPTVRPSEELVSAADLLPGIEARVKEWQAANAANRAAGGPSIAGIPTGLTHLDQLLNGLAARLYVLSAGPAVGKTSLANHIAYHVARRYPVLYVTYSDNHPFGLALKQVCRLSGVDSSDLEKGREEFAPLRSGIAKFSADSAARLHYLQGHATTTPARIREVARELIARHSAGRCLIVLDYLQKAALTDDGRDTLREKVSRTSQRLADIAHELDSPVLAISSQNRSGYATGKQTTYLETLKESGDLEFDADAVLFLGKPEPQKYAGEGKEFREIVVAKNRQGKEGRVDVVFHLGTGSFVEVDSSLAR